MEIRDAKLKDIAGITKVLRECGLYHQDDDNPENLARTIRHEPSLNLVAIDNGMVTGFVMASYHPIVTFVWHLSVLPEYRRRRIAWKLMDKILKRLREDKDVTMVYFLIETQNKTMLEIADKWRASKSAKVYVYGKKFRKFYPDANGRQPHFD